MTLRIDLHTHLKVSKRTPLQPGEALRFAAKARELGLDGVAVTEHFHAAGFWEMYDALMTEFVYRRGRFEVDGRLFYSGAELTLEEGVDLVLLAPLHELRALDRCFRVRLSCGYHPTAEELLETISRLESPVVTILAHPYGHARGAESLGPTAYARMILGVEINARFSGEENVRETLRLAQRRRLSVTGGSDAHVHTQVGAAHTLIDCDSDSFDDLAGAIRRGRTAHAVHPDAAGICRAGRELKDRLKAALPKDAPAPAQTVVIAPGAGATLASV